MANKEQNIALTFREITIFCWQIVQWIEIMNPNRHVFILPYKLLILLWLGSPYVDSMNKE